MGETTPMNIYIGLNKKVRYWKEHIKDFKNNATLDIGKSYCDLFLDILEDISDMLVLNKGEDQ